MNLNSLKKVESFDEAFITHEQKVIAELKLRQGFETYIEGPYTCSYHKKEYCYIWAVKEGVQGGVQKIDGRGYNIH